MTIYEEIEARHKACRDHYHRSLKEAQDRITELEAVVDLIGPMLDSWDQLPGDIRSLPELENFVPKVKEIDDMMEDGPEAARAAAGGK